MNTITDFLGRKKEFKKREDFNAEEEKIVRNKERGCVSYYDEKGDTHVCEFRLVRGGIACLGLWSDLEDRDVYDCIGENFSHFVYELAGEMVKYECDDFVGWSL